MECRVCGAEIPEDGRFCPSCGNRTDMEQDETEIIEAAVAEAEEIFDAELKSIEESSGDSDQTDDADFSTEKRKSARDRLRELKNAVQQKADSAIEMGRKVGDSTTRAIKKTREVSDDVTKKVGTAVDKTKEFSDGVAVQADKVRTGVKKAAVKTRETVDELGQVGAIITKRALDVVRASILAVEIVDNYLEKKDSIYEVGNFITGVGIPPYLEIEFTKRSDDISNEERKIIRMLRESDYSDSTMEEVSELLQKGRIDDETESEK